MSVLTPALLVAVELETAADDYLMAADVAAREGRREVARELLRSYGKARVAVDVDVAFDRLVVS